MVEAERFVEASWRFKLSQIIYRIERDISRLLSFFLYRTSSRSSSVAVDGLELDICSGQLMKFFKAHNLGSVD